MNLLNAKTIKAGLIVGTLDVLSACIYFFIKTKGENPTAIFKYIASGVFGQKAFAGDNVMIVLGLVLHYFIAFAFTFFFFWLYPRIKFLSANKILAGIIYGVFVWMVMNLAVVPLSRIAARPFNIVNAIINAVILIICIGLPLSFMAYSFYKKTNTGNSVIS